MTRKALILIGVILIALAVPATALGSKTWAVKNSSGKKIGTVRVYSKARAGGIIARVNNNAGARQGFLYRRVNGGYLASMATASDTAPRALLRTVWGYKDLPGWSLISYNDWENPTYVGRVIKRGGRWRAQTVGDFYHTMGSVSGRAPAWVASGGVFCLHKWWWTWPSP